MIELVKLISSGGAMKKEMKVVIFLIFIALVIYILRFSPLAPYFFTEVGRAEFFDKFSGYIKGLGFWAPFMFIFLYAISVLFFVPASLFTSIGALIFGKWIGLIYNLLGAYLGGAVSFYIARYLLRDMASKMLSKGNFKQLDDRAANHGFSVIMYLRLMFVPFTYLNFAVGLSKIKFKDFFWGTFVGVIPGLVVVTFMVSALKELGLKFAQHHSIMKLLTSDIWRADVVLPLLLFAFSFFIPSLIKHFKNKFNVTPEIEEETGAEK
jgi:uncharacterized membrane protein YdjX (TVP38/TMEM64 family)